MLKKVPTKNDGEHSI